MPQTPGPGLRRGGHGPQAATSPEVNNHTGSISSLFRETLSMQPKIGFMGLGIMGMPMAANSVEGRLPRHGLQPQSVRRPHPW